MTSHYHIAKYNFQKNDVKQYDVDQYDVEQYEVEDMVMYVQAHMEFVTQEDYEYLKTRMHMEPKMLLLRLGEDAGKDECDLSVLQDLFILHSKIQCVMQQFNEIGNSFT